MIRQEKRRRERELAEARERMDKAVGALISCGRALKALLDEIEGEAKAGRPHQAAIFVQDKRAGGGILNANGARAGAMPVQLVGAKIKIKAIRDASFAVQYLDAALEAIAALEGEEEAEAKTGDGDAENEG